MGIEETLVVTMTNSPGGSQARIRLGDLLVKAGVISDSQLKVALKEQKQWGGKLGDTLVRMRYLTEDVFVRALSKQLGLPRADLSRSIPLDALARVPAALAEEYELVPLGLADGGRSLVVATADPLNVTVLDAIQSITGLRVVAQVAGPSQIRTAISRLYRMDALPDADGQPMEVMSNAGDVRSVSPPTHSQAHLAPTPAFGVPVARLAGEYRTQLGTNAGAYAGAPTPALGMQRVIVPHEKAVTLEESQRHVAALRALVELLVQKGVISLDEYLARLPKS